MCDFTIVKYFGYICQARFSHILVIMLVILDLHHFFAGIFILTVGKRAAPCIVPYLSVSISSIGAPVDLMSSCMEYQTRGLAPSS